MGGNKFTTVDDENEIILAAIEAALNEEDDDNFEKEKHFGREWNEDDHPRDEDGKWTDAGGGDGGGSGDSSGGGGSETGTTEYPAGWETIRPAATDHPGISSDLDFRPGQPMPTQSGAVTVNVGITSKAPDYREVPISVNPTTSTVKQIIKESYTDAARALQDRAGNVFVWPAGVIHVTMMDALAPVETMWASDIWEIKEGKINSVMGSGTAMAVDWISRGQQNAKNSESTTVGFVSPNVKTDLDFTGAVDALKSPQQAALFSASAAIDRAVGVKAKETGIIGAWLDGAENSVMMTAASDWDHGVLATVMKGHLADQKSVLVFQQDRKGEAVLAHFTAEGKLEEIHKNLLADGLAFHTLVPIKDGAVVYVADLDGSAQTAIEKGADRYGSKINVQFGKAEFIGDTSGQGSDREQRDRARAIYEEVINRSPVPGSQTIWSDVRNRWGAAKKVKAARFESTEVKERLAALQRGHYIQDPATGLLEGSEPGPDTGEGGGSGGGGGGSTHGTVTSAQTGVDRGAKNAKANGIKPLTGSIGHPNLISTRLASAKGVDQTIFRQPSLTAMKENPTNFAHDMALFKNTGAYPNLRPSESKGSSDQIAQAVIAHAKENLRFLYDNAPKETREHGKFWYDGARTIVNEKVDQYKLNDASVTGVYAALSPQKLWDANVYLGDRVIEIHQTQQDTPWSKQMGETSDKIWKTERTQKVLALVAGKKLSELKSPAEKAMWIRTYDETYSNRNFHSISPLGERGDFVKNKDGSLSRAAWQSLPSITNAVRSLESNGDPAIISKAMGTQHKVRSFFNNILDPYSKNDDVTMDTHAVGAALLRPLSGSDAAVLHSMGLGPDRDKQPPGWEAASGSIKTGVQGLYGIYATAYRELAHELKIAPRQLQSITWEAKRKLFDRGLTDAENTGIEATWQDYHDGKMSLKETQRKVVEIAGGFSGR